MIDSMRTRAGRIVLVDAGSFTGSQGLTTEPRALFLCEMMKQLGYDAITIGDGELRLDPTLLRALVATPGLPFVSANLFDVETGQRLGAPSRIVEKDGVRVGITAITVPTPAMSSKWDEAGIEARDAEEALGAELGGLRQDSDVVVLVARTEIEKAKQLVERLGGGIDVVVVGNSRAGRGRVHPEAGGAVYVTAGNRGQALGIAELALGEDGRQEAMITYDSVLFQNVSEDSTVLATVQDFQRALNDLLRSQTFARETGRRSGDGHYYMGASSCADCHTPEYEVWRDTPHSSAFQTLVDIGTDALPECYGCHVTGHADPAGYDPGVEGALGLVNVQCEVCHGKGSGHARDGSYGRELLMKSCSTCHDEENSPDWDPEVYWLMIEH